MKKTIVLPNGQTEVVEGTPEEISEYEKKKAKEQTNESPKSQRKILNEDAVRAIAREEAAKLPRQIVHTHSYCSCPICCPYKPIWVIPDVVKPWTTPYTPIEPYVVTTTSTDTLKLDDLIDSASGNTIPFVGTYMSTNSCEA